MKHAIALASLAVSVALTGCVAYGPPGPGPGPYAYGPYPAEAVAYDGFYDGAYGPFYDGYWARDGYFYYSDRNHGFHRDFGGHFRHEGLSGYHPFHGGGARGGGHPEGGQHR
jgi:hypothetical protein